MFLSSESVESVCFSSDGKQIASGSWDNTVKIWNASSGELQSTLRGHSHDNPECTCTFDDDGDLEEINPECPVTGHTRYVPTLALLVLKVVLVAHSSAMRRDVNCVGFDPTGKKLVSCSDDGTVRVWDATTGEPIGSPLRGDKQVNCVAFSPDGDMLAAGDGLSGGFMEAGNVRLYDVQTGEVKSTLTGHSGG